MSNTLTDLALSAAAQVIASRAIKYRVDCVEVTDEDFHVDGKPSAVAFCAAGDDDKARLFLETHYSASRVEKNLAMAKASAAKIIEREQDSVTKLATVLVTTRVMTGKQVAALLAGKTLEPAPAPVEPAAPVLVAPETLHPVATHTEEVAADDAVDVVEAIKNYATAHYNEGGWDILVECHTDQEIAEALGNTTSLKQAIRKVRKAFGLGAQAAHRKEVMAAA
jgi:hypothetical protein